MKTMCPLSYHPDGFVATHALGHMMYVHHVPKCMSSHKAIVVMTGWASSYAHLACARSEHSFCRRLLMTTLLYIYIYIYTCIYVYLYKRASNTLE